MGRRSWSVGGQETGVGPTGGDLFETDPGFLLESAPSGTFGLGSVSLEPRWASIPLPRGVSRKARRPCERPQSGSARPAEASLRCGLDQALVQGCPRPGRYSGLEPQCQRPGAEGSGRTGPGTGPAFLPRRFVPGVRARPAGSRGTRDAAVPRALLRGGEDRRAGQRGPRTRATEGLSAQSLPPAGRKGAAAGARGCRAGEGVPGRPFPQRAHWQGQPQDFPQRNTRHLQERKSGQGGKPRVNRGRSGVHSWG